LSRRLAAAVPRSVELDDAQWGIRHRWIMRLLWLHAVAMVVGAYLRSPSVGHVLADGVPVAVLAAGAASTHLDRRTRSMVAALGLMTSSAILVHLGNGSTEMHFHFFVMIGVIGLYQDWAPFLLAIGFVGLHHGVLGVLSPHQVFDNPAAQRQPVLWAGIHTGFVLAASAVSVATWQIVERGNRAARSDLEASERRFRALIENASDVLTLIDSEGRIVYDSPAAESVLGFAAGERLGLFALSVVHPDDLVTAGPIFAEVMANEGVTCRLEARAQHRDGSWVWVDAALINLSSDPAVGCIVVNFRDVSERKALEAELAHNAFHDPLTGLANRALLLDRTEQALHRARRHGTDVALLFLDVDDFKTVNDALGHAAGDGLLQALAGRIGTVVRPGDTASRLGGDEFAILLDDLSDPSSAYEIGSRLLEGVAAPVEHGGASIGVNASIGVVVAVADDDAASLLRNAELAMYRAKGQGKGRLEIYEATMHAAAVERMAMKAEIEHGIERGEFVPWFQPIVDLTSDRVVGVEALARWEHVERGLVQPIAFIGLAEETGHIIDIGRTILRQACRQLRRWRDDLGDAAPGTISVNASPRQLQHETFVDDVAAALAESGLAPADLFLEITESALVDDAGIARSTLGRLDDMGVRIVLDDFGTGYSSLSYLEQFPVHALKIDKSFVDTLSPLVSVIIGMAHRLGLPVTAEGIETERQLEALRALGCNAGQGYLLSRPVPAAGVSDWLRARGALAVAP
jgi:diguanylate cyclase (GGDEF)-like protein/PAS domain S-box-containing protein